MIDSDAPKEPPEKNARSDNVGDERGLLRDRLHALAQQDMQKERGGQRRGDDGMDRGTDWQAGRDGHGWGKTDKAAREAGMDGTKSDRATVSRSDHLKGDPVRAATDAAGLIFHPQLDKNVQIVGGMLKDSVIKGLGKTAEVGIKSGPSMLALEAGALAAAKSLIVDTVKLTGENFEHFSEKKALLPRMQANYGAGVLDGLADQFGVDRSSRFHGNADFNSNSGIYREGYKVAGWLEGSLKPEAIQNIGKCLREPGDRATFEKALMERIYLTLGAAAAQYRTSDYRRKKH